MDARGVYLQQHWAAAAGGVDLARRVAGSHTGDEGATLHEVAREITEDREALRELMVLLGHQPGLLGPVVARVGERVGRLKPNGRLVSRSPVSDVLELEALRAAVCAKQAGWDALLAREGDLPEVATEEVARLRARAKAQLERLTAVHAELARRCLSSS